MMTHVTKRQATQMATGEEPYLSGMQCACGCGGFLSSKAANRGWKFLIGHKIAQAGGHQVTKFDIAQQGRKPGPKTLSSTNWKSIEAFVMADLSMKQNRINVLTARLVELANEQQSAEAELSRLRKEHDDKLSALSILIPESDKQED